ncbi:MAG: altronate hydrolase [Actinomycetota bacterium]|nr:altronate hydrolase [Actinomycetota bacterium]
MSALLLRLAADDDVAIARTAVRDGDEVAVPDGPRLTCPGPVPAGHKVALHDLAAGSPVRKYGHVIGVTTRDIRAGEHVHEHNLGMPEAVDTSPTGRTASPAVPPRPELPAGIRRTFDGFRRPGGTVGTRNYIGVLTTVNCSATVARQIARRTEDQVLADHPGAVDGVIALTHGTGCGMASRGEGWDVLRRTLRGYARHPNLGGLLVVGLGCEVNDLRTLTAGLGTDPALPVCSFTIQDSGGTAAAVAHGVDRVRAMAADLGGAVREEADVSHLVLGLKCGGSDAWSGLTANPALGVASDLLVAAGGTSVLAETPEIHGAERLLVERAVHPEVANALLERVHWWSAYAERSGTTLDGNPSPGNRAGGITTILEKSLGAVAKSGHAPLEAVCRYAEEIPGPGLVFMDTPGYDPVSVTGMVAGGANLICFTTGRGSVFGSRPAPTVKLATNADLARRMPDDLDLDCSGILEAGTGVDEMGRRVYDLLLDVASGRRTRSEALGLGGEEFVPWQIGAVL